ncbi:beta-propeller domain-containing protein [Mariniblastus fucicola]|uniref:Beta propeller domain protein n=1 Tax=Mariniblastus fucicola TaxID=980251 RepID=A0A5B9P7F8_9BACT|nr:beta-propeller domain-containing protein [Mariniblastus fucicola]QEG20536.1 Beta propeller domain protein [Mariniblastus fucicola]
MTQRIAKKSRKTRNSGSSKPGYGVLENRQVLTSMIAPGWLTTSFDVPVNQSETVLSELADEPEVSVQPENGTLVFNSNDNSLVYQPDNGFVGKDSFHVEGYDEFTVNVWHAAWATPDWQRVDVGGSATIDVLANDYAFVEQNQTNSDALRTWWSYSNNRFSWLQDSTGFSIVDFTQPEAGSVSVSADGRSLSFQSDDGFAGQQTVTYTLEDQNGFQTTGEVVFEVTDKAEDPRGYISVSQWQQERVESWMNLYAQRLGGNHGYYDRFSFGLVVNGFTTNAATLDLAEQATSTEVQQGDIVKSQGDLLYYVTYGDSQSEFRSYLSIVDVSDANDPTLLSTTGFESRISDIFLDEGRVAVVLVEDFGRQAYGYIEVASTHELRVLDVTSPVVPEEVYSATIDGQYNDARLIGDQLHLISQHDTNQNNSPWQLTDITDLVSPGDYIEAILQQENGFALPTVTVTVDGLHTTVTPDIDQVVRRTGESVATFITTFDVQGESGQPVDMDLVQSGYLNTVYASAQSIYLFDGDSAIKLSIDSGGDVDFSADGTLQGRMVNQFSIDEYEGMLRVVATDFADSSVDVHVFEQVGDSLNVVGSLEDIAPNESVFSTRFAEDQVFVVTFRQIDPLFVIDLSDATAPTVTGELKIPGVSNYLQLIGDDILLAVGRDADADTGRQGDLQVSLFDVADPQNPLLLDRYSFAGGRGTTSPLIDWISSRPDHHALTFDHATGTLALPISQYVDGELFSNVTLFEIGRENGIQLSGDVDFESTALRTVIAGERVVYFSEDSLKTADIADPTTVMATLDLPPEESQARAVGAALKVCKISDRFFENFGLPNEAEPAAARPIELMPNEVPGVLAVSALIPQEAASIRRVGPVLERIPVLSVVERSPAWERLAPSVVSLTNVDGQVTDEATLGRLVVTDQSSVLESVENSPLIELSNRLKFEFRPAVEQNVSAETLRHSSAEAAELIVSLDVLPASEELG